jgi:hypothetical protein
VKEGKKMKKKRKKEKIKVTKTAPTPIRGTERKPQEYASQVKLLLPSGRLKIERDGESIPVA